MFLQELFQLGVYKASQGRITRRITGAALWITICLCAWSIRGLLINSVSAGLLNGIPLAIAAVGLWVSYRVVNVPRFADFLIAVEAEMKKVSWPSRAELIRSSLVVIIVIFALMGILWVFDLLWGLLFRFVLRIG
jgi:preprotein translocase subunit SecE